METPRDTEAKTILDAGIRLAAGKVIPNPNPESRAFVLVPEDHILEYLEQSPLPMRKKGIIKLDDCRSFVKFFNESNAEGQKAIYASLDPLKFTGILNDHIPTENPVGKNDQDGANWRDFGCSYIPTFSKEWNVWTGKNRQPFEGNESFAVWLEDNLPDVIDPPNSRLLEIALNFRVNSNASFSNVKRLQDGNTDLTYSNAVEGSSSISSGKVSIPETIRISIPVFQGRNAQAYEIEAKFRYTLTGSVLKIRYELVRPHKVLEQAFNDMVDQIEADTKQDVLYGLPDAK